MRAITGAITLDREFLQAAVTLGEQILSERPLPMAVNGLSGGAQDAFVTELARKAAEFTGQGGVVFVNDEKDAMRTVSLFHAAGLGAVFYPARDFVFYNISASHDTERERLAVLARILSVRKRGLWAAFQSAICNS